MGVVVGLIDRGLAGEGHTITGSTLGDILDTLEDVAGILAWVVVEVEVAR